MISAGTKVKISSEKLDYGLGKIIEYKFDGFILGNYYHVYLVRLESGINLQVSNQLLTVI